MIHLNSMLLLLLIFVLFEVGALSRKSAYPGYDDIKATANIPGQEMVALFDLYNQTDGEHWVWYTDGGVPWNFVAGANPCIDQWQGINCSFVEPFENYHVVSIYLEERTLYGSLPNTIGLLSELQYLDLGRNYIYGALPEGIGSLTNLSVLILAFNAISGTLPGFLSNLSSLTDLNLRGNVLSGPLPSELDKLQNLTQLWIDNNYLTGSMPATLGSLQYLQTLNAENNFLSQSIPSSLGLLSQLLDLALNGNELSGPIPDELQGLRNLNSFELAHNKLSGTVPSFLCNLTNLQGIGLYINEFTGTIHASLSNLQNLLYIELSNNHLTGSIPDSLTTMANLSQVYIYFNHLTGTIPANIGAMARLIVFSAFQNRLTGTIPTSIARLSILELFVVNNNQLTGHLDEVFNAVTQTNLETVIVNNNQLTGTFPTYLFNAPYLKTFVAVSNCFHGQLDAQLCEAQNLITLVLDGLSSATSCRQLLTAGLSSSYVNANPVRGSIPSCLFQMPNLTILHMSGNSFSGTLPGDLVLSNSLFDLTLSHNVLTGSIPAAIQQRKWYNLDLSYNRFGGTLDSQFATQNFNFTYAIYYSGLVRAYFLEYLNISDFHFNRSNWDIHRHHSFSVENNRLSGRIPQSAQDLAVVSVLGTNLFSCELNGDGLPEHDPGRRNYQCGSTAFNIPYYIWLSLCGAIFGAVAVVYSWHQRSAIGEALSTAQKWLAAAVPPGKDGLRSFEALLYAITRLSMWLLAVVLLVLLPVYCVLATYCATLTYEYTWFASAAFMSGSVPAGVLFALWCILLCGVVCAVVVHTANPSGASAAPGTAAGGHSPSLRSTLFVYAVYVLVNLVVVIGANAAYVYVYIYQSAELQVFAQVMLSFFKMTWNNVCTTYVLRATTKISRGVSLQGPQSASAATEELHTTLQMCVALLNNIVIPCLVVAFVSPSCFYNVFVDAPVVESNFFYPSCKFVADDGSCDNYVPDRDSTSYNPPFMYSYQCSASMITYYAPAFINLCIVATFIAPAVQWGLLCALGAAVPGSRLHKLLSSVVPFVLRSPSLRNVTQVSESEGARPVLYNVSQVYASILTFVGLLLTFGVVFPPLALALCVTVLVTAYFSKLKVGRFLCAAEEQKLPQLVDFIDQDCQAVGTVPLLLRNSMWMVVTIACWFYTLFLFDTLGDAVGLEGAYWVLIVMPLMPLVLFLAVHLYGQQFRKVRHPGRQPHNAHNLSESSAGNPLYFSKAEDSAGLSDSNL